MTGNNPPQVVLRIAVYNDGTYFKQIKSSVKRVFGRKFSEKWGFEIYFLCVFLYKHNLYFYRDYIGSGKHRSIYLSVGHAEVHGDVSFACVGAGKGYKDIVGI